MAALVCAALALSACTPSGATCPPDSSLTYENFGGDFFSKYCTRCHSATLTGEARHSAPTGRNYDTREEVQADIGEIDEEAAAGPNSVNTGMPKDAPFPTDDERRMLGEWLACGAK